MQLEAIKTKSMILKTNSWDFDAFKDNQNEKLNVKVSDLESGGEVVTLHLRLSSERSDVRGVPWSMLIV